MNRKVLKKLSSSVSEADFSVRVENVLNNANIGTFIQIYEYQEGNGGYPFEPNSRFGLRQLRYFGWNCQREVDAKLARLGLPDLKHAREVIREYHVFSDFPDLDNADFILLNVLKGALQAFGKKHDPDTLAKIISIV